MAKRWRWMPTDSQALERLTRESTLHPVIAQLLLARGISEATRVASFLDPKLTDLRDPEQLPGLTKAANQLYAAVRDKRKIVVYGDYDADGMTATSILMGCLRQLHADVTYYVPNRLEDGYGLSTEAIERLAERGREVIVSVDCGIGSIEEAALCRRLGLELIITDHHAIGEKLPDASAIAHPALPGSSYPFHGLCGASVAFKLAWAICQRYSNSARVNPELREFLLQAIGYAAIGTISDFVPLLDENRTLVRHGLISLLQRPSCGMEELLKVAKLAGKSNLSSEDIAYSLGPRLNAAGRLGQAQLAVELLTTRDRSRAEVLAQYLDKLNADRDTLEKSVQLAATKQIREQLDPENDPALVVAGHGWHAGVIGIVAGRLAEKFHRPTIVIALDPTGQKLGIGSARSAGIVNLHETLNECADHLVSYGGHADAAGLKLEESKIPIFRQAFFEAVAGRLGGKIPEAELLIDAQAILSQIDLETLLQIEKLAPFGAKNSRPVLGATGVMLSEPPKLMGPKEQHFSGRFRQYGSTVRGIAFGQAEWVAELTAYQGPIDIAFRPTLNEFQGLRRVELQIVDWRKSEAGVPEPHINSKLKSESVSA